MIYIKNLDPNKFSIVESHTKIFLFIAMDKCGIQVHVLVKMLVLIKNGNIMLRHQ